MFERILIPLDGSEFAAVALPYGEEISRAFGSELTLLHVCTRECSNYKHIHKIYMDNLIETVSRDLLESQMGAAKLKVTEQIEEGDPLQIIEVFAKENHIDLLVMTRTGTSGSKIGVLGSVADHISRTVKLPVLLVKPSIIREIESKLPSIKRILVTLDGSDLARQALPVAEELANKLQIPITLFQMARDFSPYYGEPAPFVDYEKITEDEQKKVRAELSLVEQELKKKGQQVESAVTSGSDAAHEIIEMSKKLEDCLLVMSTHGRSGVGRWAMGSVAEKVLHYIDVPLLLVPSRTERAH
jgi:nucleotide-binding universal stress UspA family protein